LRNWGNGTATPSDTGDLNATDPDNASDAWTAVAAGAASANGYGTYGLTAAGVWTYTLDNGNASVQALNGAATLTDSFTALTEDGTAQVVTITINAANDAPAITGDSAGDVTEAGGVGNVTPGTASDTGNLDSDDVDNPDYAWTAVAAGAATANGYGTYALTAAGVWTYTVDDGNAAVQALQGAAKLTDTFTAGTVDGTTQVVTITINAQNDAPDNVVVSGGGTPLSVAENGPNGSSAGTLVGQDVDDTSLTYTLLDNAGGRFAIDATTGVVTVANAGLVDFEAASSHSITVRASDPSNLFADRVFTVAVTDRNDVAPAITTAAAQSVVENTTVVAALASSDPDTVGTNPAAFTITGGADAAKFGIVGGNLVFLSAPNFEAPTDADANNSYLVEVTANDGANTTPKTITVTVTNANEAPTDLVAGPLSVVENSGIGTLVGTVVAQGADGQNLAYVLTDSAGGRFAIDNAGNISVSNSLPISSKARATASS
jgi:VCBS repeat-containing protein